MPSSPAESIARLFAATMVEFEKRMATYNKALTAFTKATYAYIAAFSENKASRDLPKILAPLLEKRKLARGKRDEMIKRLSPPLLLIHDYRNRMTKTDEDGKVQRPTDMDAKINNVDMRIKDAYRRLTVSEENEDQVRAIRLKADAMSRAKNKPSPLNQNQSFFRAGEKFVEYTKSLLSRPSEQASEAQITEAWRLYEVWSKMYCERDADVVEMRAGPRAKLTRLVKDYRTLLFRRFGQRNP